MTCMGNRREADGLEKIASWNTQDLGLGLSDEEKGGDVDEKNYKFYSPKLSLIQKITHSKNPKIIL